VACVSDVIDFLLGTVNDDVPCWMVGSVGMVSAVWRFGLRDARWLCVRICVLVSDEPILGNTNMLTCTWTTLRLREEKFQEKKETIA